MSGLNKLYILIALLCVCGLAQAEDAKTEIIDNNRNFERIDVQWVNPKKFTDIRPSNESRARFKKHVFAQLENHFEELSMALPQGQSLEVNVINLDLAGRVEPGTFVGLSSGINDIRILRNIDIPRIKFEYKLMSDNGAVIKNETVNLKDMNYLFHSNHTFVSREAFGYEKRMLTEWFKANLINSE